MDKRFLATVALVALIPTADFLHTAWSTPHLVLLAAATPAVVITLVAIAFARGERRISDLVAATFFWGAIAAAFVSSSINELARVWMSRNLGDAGAHFIAPSVVAPLVEEAAKGAALLLLMRHRGGGIGDGIVYGGLIGVGFAMAENLQYFLLAAIQGGTTGLGQAMYVRTVLGGLNHALFTATTGAGIGWAHGASVVPAAIGFSLGVVQHVLWNTVASPEITDALCNAPAASGSCLATPDVFSLLVTAPLIAAASLAPGALLLGWAFLVEKTRGRAAGGWDRTHPG